ncbi:MAG: hypothetical protein O3B13_01575 [Planctomycetota bacterium]|nr:hypothetical protein [Planctomycetota bacterium]
MDKLQPIIKHHFWIVFFVALILPPIAWWMTSSELAAEIDERTSSLDGTFDKIASGQNAPNEDWAAGVNQLISIRTEANRLALDRLWTAQNDLMQWPPNVANWMNDCPYRGEVEDARIKQILPDLYREDYEREVRRVWLIPEPIDDGKTRVDAGLKQKVVFPYEQMPRTAAAKWTVLPPTWKEIWNAQEDLWLLSEILGSVREANKSTSSITDSYVKQILQVQLFGGKRAAAPAAGGTAAPDSPYASSGMMGPRRGPAGATTLSKPAEFSISEEFEVATTGGATNYPGTDGDSSSAATGDPQSDEVRYIQSEEAYRTRGFKLKVAVHQMHVPNLIRQLLNTQYPIEIIRFQQSALNPEEPGKPTGSSAFPGRNAMAGYPGGSPTADFTGSTESSSTDETFTSSGENFSLDGGSSGTDGLAGKSYTVPAIANVQASLQDRDLVELVVVGEIYIYNPPAVNESEMASAMPVEATSDVSGTGEIAADSAAQPSVEGPAATENPVAQPAVPLIEGVPTSLPGTQPGAGPATAGPDDTALKADDSTPATDSTLPTEAAPPTTTGQGTTPASPNDN